MHAVLFRTFIGYKLHTSDGDVFPIKEAKAAASNLNLAQCARTRRKGNKVWKISGSVEMERLTTCLKFKRFLFARIYPRSLSSSFFLKNKDEQCIGKHYIVILCLTSL